MNCTSCGTALAPDSRFCHRCGTAVAQPAAPAGRPEAVSEVARLQQYIPRELLAKLEAARSQRAFGERRVVTMLFCDVKGSTAMAEKLDPEEWADIMNEVFEYLIAPIYQYEGMVARLMGDAILAFFGAPIAHEDDPQRAVLAGLRIVEAIRPYRERLQRERGLEFNVRVGINTGLAVVGEVGSDLRVEYTAMGDAVNLAARMEQTAQPGTVQISGHTYRLVAPLFECQSLGGVQVKGKTEPVPAYQVLRARAQPGRLRGIKGLEAPLTGRQDEMAALRQVMDEVRAGHGRIVCLMGEAGLGKSRLIHELHIEWQRSGPAGERPGWGETRSASYAASRPYGQIQQLIRNLNDMHAYEPPEITRDKIARAAARLPADQPAHAARVLEALLVVEATDAEAAPRLEGEAFKNELVGLMRGLLGAWASASAAVIVFDDLHWADPASADLLISLLPLAAEQPILFLCAFRPDSHSHPGERVRQAAEENHRPILRELRLGPLAVEDSAALAGRLLSLDALPAALRDTILLKAEGNPFFIEEVIRTLIDSGAVRRDEAGAWQAGMEAARLTLPDSLQSLLMARLDRLDEAARLTLQLAAVIGRSFDHRLLASVSEAGPDLDEHLSALQAADLIRETARAPERAFSFRHALTQETAYHSILRKRRRAFHLRVGEALESMFPDRLDENAPLLGHHFYEADETGRAVKHLTRAGDLALRLYANAEAVAHYSRALELARRGGEEPDRGAEQFAHLYLNCGQALELNAQYDAALTNYQDMESLARARGDRELELKALIARAKIHSTPNPKYDPAAGRALSERSLTLARALGDRVAEARILWSLMLLTMASGQTPAALEYGEQAVRLARQLGLHEQLAFALNDIHRGYRATGQLERAQAALAEAQALWRELDNRPMLVDNLASAALIDYLQGSWERALTVEAEAHRISQAINNLWGQAYSRQVVGYILFERGEPDRAIAAFEETVRLSEQAGLVPLLAGVRADLGWMYGYLGAVDHGLTITRAALAVADRQFALFRAWPLAILARLHCLDGDLAEAQAALRECRADRHRDNLAIFAPFLIALAEGETALLAEEYPQAIHVMDGFLALLRRTGMSAYLAEALCCKGQALLALGRAGEAHEILNQARVAAEALGAHRTLWVILFELSRIAAQAGSLDEADELRRAAHRLVQSIADRCPATLRPLFAERPLVRAARAGLEST